MAWIDVDSKPCARTPLRDARRRDCCTLYDCAKSSVKENLRRPSEPCNPSRLSSTPTRPCERHFRHRREQPPSERSWYASTRSGSLCRTAWHALKNALSSCGSPRPVPPTHLSENLREVPSAQTLFPLREVERTRGSRAIDVRAQLRCPSRSDILYPSKRRWTTRTAGRHGAALGRCRITPAHRHRHESFRPECPLQVRDTAACPTARTASYSAALTRAHSARHPIRAELDASERAHPRSSEILRPLPTAMRRCGWRGEQREGRALTQSHRSPVRRWNRTTRA